MDFCQWSKIVSKDRLKYFIAMKKQEAIDEIDEVVSHQ